MLTEQETRDLFVEANTLLDHINQVLLAMRYRLEHKLAQQSKQSKQELQAA